MANSQRIEQNKIIRVIYNGSDSSTNIDTISYGTQLTRRNREKFSFTIAATTAKINRNDYIIVYDHSHRVYHMNNGERERKKIRK